MIFFTSDLHFGHSKEFLWGPRGFSSSEEHDEEVIRRWNQKVGEEDIVYILGDLMLEDNISGMSKLSRLNGSFVVIRGNHDTNTRLMAYGLCDKILSVKAADYLRDGKWTFYLSHFPTKVGNYDDEQRHNKFYNLCGHTHTSDRWLDFAECKAYHVELDAHDCTPVSIEEIKNDIRNYAP